MQSQIASVRAGIRLARALCMGITLAISASLITVAGAGAVTYPTDTGSGFTKGPEGWRGVSATCTPNLLCSQRTFWSGTKGNPPGSLESRLDILVNVGDIYQGQSTWRSPSFQATASGAGSLRYDRQIEAAGLAALNPVSSIEPVLVDETTGVAESLGSATLSSANSKFQSRTVAVPEDTLVPGHRYHLQMHSTTATSTAQVGLTGSISLRLDNVRMRIRNEGPGGSAGSEGVTFTGPFLSSKQIKKLIRNLRWTAEKGSLAGGSVVKRSDCTIVGTPGRDRIKGSTGNDVICGLGGADKINGQGGIDLIDTGAGADRVTAAGGGDAVAGLAGADRLRGNGAGDRLGGGAGGDRLAGGASKDRINGGSGKDRVVGGRRDRVAKVERRA
jgi:RTX calcium-binding nonapeptide repeat (4 copies)